MYVLLGLSIVSIQQYSENLVQNAVSHAYLFHFSLRHSAIRWWWALFVSSVAFPGKTEHEQKSARTRQIQGYPPSFVVVPPPPYHRPPSYRVEHLNDQNEKPKMKHDDTRSRRLSFRIFDPLLGTSLYSWKARESAAFYPGSP